MKAKGYDVSPLGVADVYADFLYVLVVDSSDANLVGGYKGIEIVATDTIMKSREDAKRLAKFLIDQIFK